MHGVGQSSPPTASHQAALHEGGLLRLVACGSVDDGKSTLIGRLLMETGSVPEDQLMALSRLSRRYGTTGDDLDCALLLDGLESEREQGITIDVAYRYFSTPRRTFIVADTPGHEQYTRNMVTGASNADLAVLLVDVRHGVTIQTMRHSRIVALLGIRHILLVINKMDLVGFDQASFAAVDEAYRKFASSLGFDIIETVPVSARFGDNVTKRSGVTSWYNGLTVIEYLEKAAGGRASRTLPFRYLVQSVTRGERDFRGLAGVVASGCVAEGDEVMVARSGQAARVARILTYDGDLERAEAGDAVTVVLDRHSDVGRGDVIAHPADTPQVVDQFAAHLVWFDETSLLPGRTYLMRIGMHVLGATVTALKHRIHIESGDKIAGRTLNLNDIGFCNIAVATSVALDAYADNKATGAFILIDRESAATVGAGMIEFPLRRATNIQPQHFEVDKAVRGRMKSQRPCIIWFTGLPGAGKSTIMNLVERRLTRRGIHTYALDGDNMRHGLSRDLGFTDADRVENIRRAGEVAKLMVDAGLVVLCAFISPFRAERKMVRDLVGAGEFVEIYVDTPLEICIARDPKGLYAKARTGKVQHVTGLDSPYEKPETPELHILTAESSAEGLADHIVEELERRGVFTWSY